MLRCVNTSSVSMTGSAPGSSKPDVGMNLDSPKIEETYTGSKSKFANFRTMESFIEVKKAIGQDPFRCNDKKFIKFDLAQPYDICPRRPKRGSIPLDRTSITRAGYSRSNIASVSTR